MRVLSGIQPTGRPHWGNYFGAIRQYIDLQNEDESYYFIANLHALTTVRDPALLAAYTLDAATDLLALGLDPQRATMFVQSDVPEVSELCWLLLTGTPMGLLERCHAYKDKKAKGLTADAGLFTYPVLDGGRHSGLRRRHRAGRRRPVAAHRGVPRFGRQLQSPIRPGIRDAQRQDPGRLGQGARHRRRKNVEELQQHARDFRGSQAAAQEDHADHHRFAAHGRAQGAGGGPPVSVVFPGGRSTKSARRWPPCIAAAVLATAT